MGRRSRWKWSEKDLFLLDDLIARGVSDEAIAKRLGASVNGIRVARKRYGIRSRTEQLMSSRAVAEMLGVGCAKTITRWIESGWLEGKQGQRRGRHRQWQVTELELWAFMEDPAHWHRWHPERIPDPHLREWAVGLRGGVRYLTLSEVGRRCYVEPHTVHQWISKGLLPAVRNGNHLVPESALDGFVVPSQRTRKLGPRVIRRMVQAGASWSEVPAPSPFRRVRILRQAAV